MSAERSWSGLLAALLRGEPLATADTNWAMDEIMSGNATQAQIAGFVIALRAKGETPDEVTGLATAMVAHARPAEVDGRIVDLVGTGGDPYHAINISTVSAVVAAAAGARVVKHGNRAASSASGAADLLEQLGVAIELDGPGVARCVAKVGIGFCFAAHFHPAMRHAAGVRRELGVPTFFNFLGPLSNPARPAAQAIGCANERIAPVLAQVLANRGTTGMVSRGDDGLDKLTTCTTSRVWVVGSDVAEVRLDPVELGVPRADADALRGKDATHNASVARAVLAGERGPVRDAVLLNAAAGIAAYDGISGSLTDALRPALTRAAEAVDTGRAAAKLEEWIAVSQAALKEQG